MVLYSLDTRIESNIFDFKDYLMAGELIVFDFDLLISVRNF